MVPGTGTARDRRRNPVVRALGAAWAEIVSATEWASNGGRLRSRWGERVELEDPYRGMGPPDRAEDEQLAERGTQPKE